MGQRMTPARLRSTAIASLAAGETAAPCEKDFLQAADCSSPLLPALHCCPSLRPHSSTSVLCLHNYL
jgi:hypothetical protein